MSRISTCFRRAKASGRGAMIPYVTAGHPTMEATVEIAAALAAGGADILELGVPFSDPVADGPVIQRASEIALENGATLERCLDAAREIRRRSDDMALVLFSYYNPLLQYGLERLAARLVDIGVDGLLVTDVVPEESEALTGAMWPRDIDTVFLAAPTSSDERLRRIAAVARGFVYVVSRTGVTGTRETMAESARRVVEGLRPKTDLPIAVGFGISTLEQVESVWSFADGAVVGSRLVSAIADATDTNDAVERAMRCFSSLIPARRAGC